MKLILSSLILFVSYLPAAYANLIYKRVPFDTQLNLNDSLVVNYNFKAQPGLRCEASVPHIRIKFKYKGVSKSDYLPIQLENNHLPRTKIERLADIKGQLTLNPTAKSPSKKTSKTFYAVHCKYLQ